ncbi:MAG: Ribbon-helix-helix protein, copG family [Candidatus Bathyarchaeota archaeon BA1]|nr:MAG: Ribbon-helix-helix protein, copG family [Candidatus Bathyarchaeota archaeon BA1]
MGVTSVATKLTKKENELLERLTKEYGFISKSEVIRSAVRLYLNLLSLEHKDRLRMLQLINEVIAPSRKTAAELMEEAHKEEEV